MSAKILLNWKGRFELFRKNSGGFVFAEFAIALPLLILLGWGLATVSLKLFDVGKNQLADYVLEEEVHEVLSRIIYDARAAKKVTAENDAPTLIFTYRTIKEVIPLGGGIVKGDVIADCEENRVYMLVNDKIHYKRQTTDPVNPITGNNYFGETRVTEFEFSKPAENVLHVTLELESEITHHKIKISTAIYMPGCKSFMIY